MEREVLEVSTFPRITFTSRDIHVVKRGARQLELQIAGDLVLHGVRRRQTAAVLVDVEPGRITATGTLVVKQTDFGIEPVRAGAGTVRVKDEVDVHFTLVAVPAGRAQQPTVSR